MYTWIHPWIFCGVCVVCVFNFVLSSFHVLCPLLPVSGLSILDYLYGFSVSLDCLYLITSMVFLCLWIVYTWLPIWFFCVSGLSILDYLYDCSVSLDCLYLITSMVFLCLWSVYTWLPLWYFCVSGLSILDYLYGISVSLDCLYLITSSVFLYLQGFQ